MCIRDSPITVIAELKGKVYQRTIQKNEIDHFKQNYEVISEKLFHGQPVIRILSESVPKNGFELVQADLEDVYFAHIFGQ